METLLDLDEDIDPREMSGHRISVFVQFLGLVSAVSGFSGCSLTGSRNDGSATRPSVHSGDSTTIGARPICGASTPLRASIEGLPGARVGPLLFFALGKGPRAETAYVPGYPTKVRLRLTEELGSSLALQGWRCADEKPLRFWYREDLPFVDVPVSRKALETTGDLVASLEPHDRPIDYTGYMLFTSTGKWDIAVLSRGRAIGHVVIRVVAGELD